MQSVWHGCSSVNLRHIVRAPFPKNISGGLLLPFVTPWFSNFLIKISNHVKVELIELKKLARSRDIDF